MCARSVDLLKALKAYAMGSTCGHERWGTAAVRIHPPQDRTRAHAQSFFTYVAHKLGYRHITKTEQHAKYT